MAAKLEIIVEAEAKKAERELKDFNDEMERTEKQSEKQDAAFDSSIVAFASFISIAKEAAAALRQVYATAREGAEIKFLEDRFERLAESIGTTADVLLNELREATQGTLSDMEAMALATDLVGLGLAKDSKEAVRMARVVSGLGADMNQVVLTLTNMTTMRFDAIGLRVDGFKDKVAELEEQGLDTNAAFTEAFLQQGEKQLEVVGEAADSTLGSFKKLEAASANLANAFKTDLAEATEGYVKELAVFIDNSVEAADKMDGFNIGQRKVISDLAILKFGAETAATQIAVLAEMEELAAGNGNDLAESMRNTAVANRDLVVTFEKSAEEIKEISKGYTDFLSLTTKLASETKKFNKSQADNIAKQEEVKTKIAEATVQYGAQSDKVKGLEDDLLNLGIKYEENAEKHKAATDKILFDLLLQKLSVDGLTDAEFDAALAAGVMFGVFDAQSAQAASDMNTVTQAVTDGVLRVEDMDKALRLLPRLTNIDVVIDAIVNGLGGGAKGGISGGPSQQLRGIANRASGGTVARGQSYVVGESRPEVFTPNSSGRITPNIGGGSSIVVNLAFAPTVSLGSAEEAESVLVPFVIEGIRQAQASGLIQ